MSEFKDGGNQSDGEPWKDEERLTQLYCDELLPMKEVGERLGCERGTVKYWLDKYGIETRSPGEGRVIHYRRNGNVGLYTGSNGYEILATTYRNEYERCLHHRLLAVAEYGFEEVAEKETHHVKPIPWANWRENLRTVSTSEHGRLHAADPSEHGRAETFVDEDTLRTMYCEEERTTAEIGEEVGISTDMVRYWMDEHDIPRRTAPDSAPYHDGELLRHLYVEKGMTLSEIGDKFGRSGETIRRHMERNDIPRTW